MRTIKIILALFIITNTCYSQIPTGTPGTPQVVTDPGNNAQLVKTVDNTLRTLKISKESLDITKKALEAAKKVNNALQSSKMTIQITDNLRDTYNNLSEVPDLMDGIKNPTIRKNLVKQCNELFIDIDVFQDTVSNVLTDNILSMEDSDRLSILLNLYEKSKDILSKSERLNKIIKVSK